MAPPRKPVDARLLSRMKIDKSGCWIWQGSKTRDGYGVLGIGRKQFRAHRASYEAYKGAIPSGAVVCHSCDVPLCINPDHLFIGTHKDNTRDMHTKGRAGTPHGERHGMAKLTDPDVGHIRKLREDGMTLSAIAQIYDVSFQHIGAICQGKYR